MPEVSIEFGRGYEQNALVDLVPYDEGLAAYVSLAKEDKVPLVNLESGPMGHGNHTVGAIVERSHFVLPEGVDTLTTGPTLTPAGDVVVTSISLWGSRRFGNN